MRNWRGFHLSKSPVAMRETRASIGVKCQIIHGTLRLGLTHSDGNGT